MKEKDLGPIFYLDDWLVDTLTNRLEKKQKQIKLETKVMAVLHYLVLHQNELVTREDLESAIWGDTVVGYDALTRCIGQLRKALSDDPRKPRYIETISKKGYRLIAQVTSHVTVPVTSPDFKQHQPDCGEKKSPEAIVLPQSTALFSNRVSTISKALRRQYAVWLVAIGLSILFILLLSNTAFRNADEFIDTQHNSVMGTPSIAVLPFINLNNEIEQQYFSQGMTADITTALSKLSGLTVISYESVREVGHSDDVTHMASSLGVRYVLEGSVRRINDRIRVNVSLIDSSRDIYLWSEKYDRELRSVFDVQDDITRKIIESLAIKLSQEEKRRTANRYTTSINAYEDFLRGQYYYSHLTQESNLNARKYFQQAIDRDGNFARAYSAMALTYVAEHRYAWGELPSSRLDKALSLASKGKALNTELPQAYWVLGYVHVFRRDFNKAAQEVSIAIKLDPNYADSYLTLAVCKINKGEANKAIALAQKAMVLHPRYPSAYSSILGQAYFFAEQYDFAVPFLEDAIERNYNLLTAHVFLIATLSKLGEHEEAKWSAEKLKAISTNFSIHKIDQMLAIGNVQGVEDIKMHLQRAGL